MNYQYAPTNPQLNTAYLLRAKLRCLQAGEIDPLEQLLLGIRYRWYEILSRRKTGEKLPR